MILDSSALIAILTGEPDRDELIAAVTADNIRLMSAVSLVEAGIVLAARYGAAGGTDLDNWLDTAGVTIEPFDAHQATVARTAWLIYGKGRHPAGLNFGDCCVYALAKTTLQPILYKGQDFSQTDIPSVDIAKQS